MNEIKKIKRRIMVGLVLVVGICAILLLIGHYFFKIFFR